MKKRPFQGLLYCFLMAQAGLAQTAQPERAPMPSGGNGVPHIKWGPVTVSGSFRSRLEMWDWFQGDANNKYAFSGNIFRLSFSQVAKKFDWELELAAPFLLALPNDATAPAPQGALGLGSNYYTANQRSYPAMFFAKQGWLRFKNLFGDPDQSLKLGRFEWMDGAEVMPKDALLASLKRDRVVQRMLGPSAWTYAGRSFDGFQYVADKNRMNYTLTGALATRGNYQVDGWGELKVGFVYAAATRETGGERRPGEWRAFTIYYQDWRGLMKADNQPSPARQQNLGNIAIFNYGGHYLQKLETPAGPFNFMAWGLLQSGRWGAQSQASGIVDLEAGWHPPVAANWKPWLMGGILRSSGDGNPLDNKHGTYFELIPTARPFARFPFFNMMNESESFGILAVQPSPGVALRSEFHALRLTNTLDLWYTGGGAFQPWTFGYTGRNTAGTGSLANLWDLSADWNVDPHLNLNGYFGFANGKAVMHRIYPRGPNAFYGYVEMNYRF
jgi:hypothetical protein